MEKSEKEKDRLLLAIIELESALGMIEVSSEEDRSLLSELASYRDYLASI